MEGFTKFVLKIKETEMNLATSSIICNLQPFSSHDLIVNSPFSLLHISMLINYENLVLDHDNFYPITLNILITCFLDNVWIL